MKKLISLLLIFVLCIAVISCGEQQEEPAKDDDSSNAESTENEEEEAMEDSEEEAVEDPEEETPQFGEVVLPTVEEQVIYDGDDIKVTVPAGEISKNDVIDPEILLVIENKTENDIEIMPENMVINGLSLDNMDANVLEDIVPANSSAEILMSISSSGLFDRHIKEIGDISFDLSYSPVEEFDLIRHDDLTIKTSLSGKVTQEINTEGRELINQDGIKLVVKEELLNTPSGPGVEYYFENMSDKKVKINVTTPVTVEGNAFEDEGYSVTLKPNAKTIFLHVIMSVDVDDFDGGIHSISYQVQAEDPDEFDVIFIEPLSVELNFK